MGVTLGGSLFVINVWLLSDSVCKRFKIINCMTFLQQTEDKKFRIETSSGKGYSPQDVDML